MAASGGRGHVVDPASTVTELNAGDSSRGSHVWRVDPPGGPPLILRRAWWTAPEVSAFMLGLNRLFGVDPRDLHATAASYRFWRGLDVWAVPEVLGMTDFRGGPALAVEFVQGEPTRDFGEADAGKLGRRVARIHAHSSATFGDVTGRVQRPLGSFYPHALRVVRELADHFGPDAWATHWPEVEATFTSAPSPTRAVPMLLDWNGTQFVWRDGQPFALVDVESCALAPPELDLCLWELLLTPPGAAQFRAGYVERRPFPDLGPHRAACRLLLRALEVEGAPPLRGWLALPSLFDT